MALFKVFEQASDLPSAGTSREELSLDAKATYDPAKKFEMGKDVAAFANASGGALLIGAYEDSAKLIQYKPLSSADAINIRQAFEEAIRDRCTPIPRVLPVQIPHLTGEVLAINVWPFPGQIVGVCREGNKRVASNGFVFPIRTATQTDYLLPEQLPMLMLPDIRRIAILLDDIPMAERTDIKAHVAIGPHPQSCLPKELDASLISYTQLSNNILIKVIRENPRGLGATQEFSLPLDAIKSVWKNDKGVWCIAIKGIFDGNLKTWIYS